ncbi:carbohydrate ABC transporter permease [Paenibacillus thalictri]|uniref:Carbohydrate ABC transporter permease n=1 Tax=Paenibacillus thalictri TaxID=2527873 RepID=A0A4Q9DCN4_9BACL|nr:carbohydrate ABC transporter permease [Paenibacillus thalictri]TBL68353.1 carbohydrate ABC transporter permease [Paenibacillus thalictri]
MVTGKNDRVFNSMVYVILAFVGLAAVFPLMYVLSVSITPMSEVLRNGGFIVIPKKITFEAYQLLFSESRIPAAFSVTFTITVIGTVLNLVLTMLMAYPLSRKFLPGRSFFLLIIVFTMLFNGGLIPTYLIVKQTGLLNTVWAMIIPSAVSTFNLLIMKSFYENMPAELFESARIDGAKEMRILLQIAVPLSLPVILTVGLFYLVMHWNEFFQAIMYVVNQKLYPIQVVVRSILLQSQSATEQIENPIPTDATRMASVIVASLPVIVMYPFIQKYFTQGMMIGSIKG